MADMAYEIRHMDGYAIHINHIMITFGFIIITFGMKGLIKIMDIYKNYYLETLVLKIMYKLKNNIYHYNIYYGLLYKCYSNRGLKSCL